MSLPDTIDTIANILSIFATFTDHVNRALDQLVEQGDLPPGLPRTAVTVEPPRSEEHTSELQSH